MAHLGRADEFPGGDEAVGLVHVEGAIEVVDHTHVRRRGRAGVADLEAVVEFVDALCHAARLRDALHEREHRLLQLHRRGRGVVAGVAVAVGVGVAAVDGVVEDGGRATGSERGLRAHGVEQRARATRHVEAHIETHGELAAHGQHRAG
ncbi:hypothetical protein D9M72_455300 [compost metagenome]